MRSFEWNDEGVGVQLIGEKVIKHTQMRERLKQQKLDAKMTRIANAIVWDRIDVVYDKDGRFVCP